LQPFSKGISDHAEVRHRCQIVTAANTNLLAGKLPEPQRCRDVRLIMERSEPSSVATFVLRNGIRPVALAACLLLTGCLAPSASRSLDVAQDIGGGRVASCAEQTVASLARKDSRWDARITHRNASHGVVESGNFGEENESGFRVRVQLHARRNKVEIDLKGAGPYFKDMGVEDAIETFQRTFVQCLPRA
jgi:hypothetical protein